MLPPLTWAATCSGSFGGPGEKIVSPAARRNDWIFRPLNMLNSPPLRPSTSLRFMPPFSKGRLRYPSMWSKDRFSCVSTTMWSMFASVPGGSAVGQSGGA